MHVVMDDDIDHDVGPLDLAGYEVLEQELLSEDLLGIIEFAEIDLSLETPHTAQDWSTSSLQVKRRNDTRWSSGLFMATRFFQLKAPISAYIEKSTDRKVKLLTLTPMEWDILQQMTGVLTAPHLVSLKVRLIHALHAAIDLSRILQAQESGPGTIASCMLEMSYLVEVLKDDQVAHWCCSAQAHLHSYP